MPTDPNVSGGNDPRVKAAQELRARIMREARDPAQSTAGDSGVADASAQADPNAQNPGAAATEVAPLLSKVLQILVSRRDPNDFEQVRQFFFALQSFSQGTAQDQAQPDSPAVGGAQATGSIAPKALG